MIEIEEDPCPLVAWLDRVGESKVDFIERSGMSNRTLYDLLNATNKDYGIFNLQRIEVATRGEVTMRMIVDWLNRKQKGNL